MFISSLNSFDGTSYKGLLGEKQYFLPTCTEGYITVKGFGMNWTEQELDLAHGLFFFLICIYIHIIE